MKKFLTVLLVIAVMFTFSFSSAFAGVDYTTATFSYDQAVTELQKVASDTNKDSQDLVTKTLAGYAGSYSKEAAKVALQDACDEAVANTNKVLDNQLTALYEASKTAEEDVYNISSYVAAIEATAVVSYDVDTVDFSKAEVDVVKANVKADIEKIDLSVYSKEVASGEIKSNYDKALELVTKALNIVESQKATDVKGENDDVIMRLGWLYTPAVGLGEASGVLYENTGNTVFGVAFVIENEDGTEYFGLKDIPTTAGEAVDANKLEYAKTKALAEILGTLTADKDKYIDDLTAKIFAENQKAKPDTKKIADLEEKLTDVKAAYDDTVEVVTYLVKNAEKISQLGSFDKKNLWQGTNWLQADKFGTGEEFGRHPIDAATNAKYLKETFRVSDAVTRVKLVKEAKENAELLKATIAIDGSSAVEIDKALEKAIDEIYKGTKTDATISGYNAYEYLYHYVEETLIGGGAKGVKINGVKYDAIGTWNVALYDEAKKDEVEAIIDDAKDAVRAAETVSAADDAFMAAKAKLDAVPTAAQHAKDFTLTTGAYKKAYDDAKKEVAAYAKAKVAYIERIGAQNDYGTTKTGNNAAKNLDTLIAKYQKDLYDECFNAEEIASKLAEAKATIDGLKTDKVLGDEAAAIEKEVAALPTNATLADKDAVMAAYDKVLAHNEYCDLVDSAKKVNYAKVEKLANIIEDAEAEAIDDAIKAINKDGKVTLDEKAAVQELRKAWDAYDEFWDDYDKIKAEDFERSVAAIEKELSALEIKEVKNMIAKLSADGSSADEIVAARKAFDTLDREQQHEIRHNAGAYYDKLVDAEKVLAKAVEALKITASSKATKGAITVKWTVKGNKAAADGYQIWKSTKKNAGFKKMFTTKKLTYKNTKGLKKGVKYYYKVRAYKVVDGKKVYSDWSNKAIRVAK